MATMVAAVPAAVRRAGDDAASEVALEADEVEGRYKRIIVRYAFQKWSWWE